MWRAAPWNAALLILIGLAACQSSSIVTPSADIPQPTSPPAEPPTETAAPTPTLAADALSAVIANQSDSSLCHLYLAAPGDAEWGADRLGDTEIIAAGEIYELRGVPSGRYDFKMEDCNRSVIGLVEGFAMDASAPPTLVLSASAAHLIVANQGSADLCALYLSPAGAENWSRSLIAAAAPIIAGASREVALPAGTYDLRAETCGGESLERAGVPISGDTLWEITDP